MNDIAKIKSANVIKNGTILVGTSQTGNYSTINTYVKNTPTINTIENKYDNRFDDPGYYYGMGNSTIVGA